MAETEPIVSGEGATQPMVVAVFCASMDGVSPAHKEAARELAKTFAKKNIKLVYGGGTTGMMGEVARTLIDLKGPSEVHGVIPTPLLNYEARGLNSDWGTVTVVENMHVRKETMVKLVDAGGPGSGFVALSGGYGTMEELLEVTTWNQLGIHSRPVVIYNVDGYWNGLLDLVQKAVAENFVKPGNKEIIQEARSAEEVVEKLQQYRPSKDQYKLKWGQE